MLLTMVALLTSCSYQDCHTVNTANSDNLTVEEAMLHYNQNCADKYTRSNIDERLPFVLGDAEWLWDSAEGSSYDVKRKLFSFNKTHLYETTCAIAICKMYIKFFVIG